MTFLPGATVEGLTQTAAAASADALGGVKAEAKDELYTVEVKIGADGKLYIPAYPEEYVLPAASAEALGGVKAAANQSESVAATIAELKTDLNALLAKLKVAGVMAPETLKRIVPSGALPISAWISGAQ